MDVVRQLLSIQRERYFSLRSPLEDQLMLRLAILFLVIALLAALFGFGLVADMSYDAARILFFVFIVLAVLSLRGCVFRRPPV